MTKNQIDYWSLQENKRHNLEQEALGRGTLDESKRHNLQTEGQAVNELTERHRHNLVGESVDIGNLQESQRHNRSVEQETNRHNVTVENETHRSNVANETETNRHNVATEHETNRHNVVTEGIDLSRLDEQTRHNKASESLDLGKLTETGRHNYEMEGLGYLDSNIRQQQTDIQRSSAEASNAVKELEAAWYGFNQERQFLRDQYDFDRIEAEVKKIITDTELAKQSNDRSWMDSVSKSAGMLTRTLLELRR